MASWTRGRLQSKTSNVPTEVDRGDILSSADVAKGLNQTERVGVKSVKAVCYSHLRSWGPGAQPQAHQAFVASSVKGDSLPPYSACTRRRGDILRL